MANDGRFLIIVPERDAERTVEILAATGPKDTAPAVVGSIHESERGHVLLHSISGSERPIDMLSGEQLPRIC